jgi:hypothetical protein
MDLDSSFICPSMLHFVQCWMSVFILVKSTAPACLWQVKTFNWLCRSSVSQLYQTENTECSWIESEYSKAICMLWSSQNKWIALL